MKLGEKWNLKQALRELFCRHNYIAHRLIYRRKGIWDFVCLKCEKYHLEQ